MQHGIQPDIRNLRFKTARGKINEVEKIQQLEELFAGMTDNSIHGHYVLMTFST